MEHRIIPSNQRLQHTRPVMIILVDTPLHQHRVVRYAHCPGGSRLARPESPEPSALDLALPACDLGIKREGRVAALGPFHA